MPIIGKIYARPHAVRVETMPIGNTFMIDMNDIVVTREGIYLHIETEVLALDENETIEDFLEFQPYCVPIKRTGDGLTETDYEIDFSVQQNGDEVFLLETPAFIQNLPKDVRVFYITFTDGDICTQKRQKEESEKSIEDLQRELGEATENEDFIKATGLRDQIKEMKERATKKD